MCTYTKVTKSSIYLLEKLARWKFMWKTFSLSTWLSVCVCVWILYSPEKKENKKKKGGRYWKVVRGFTKLVNWHLLLCSQQQKKQDEERKGKWKKSRAFAEEEKSFSFYGRKVENCLFLIQENNLVAGNKWFILRLLCGAWKGKFFLCLLIDFTTWDHYLRNYIRDVLPTKMSSVSMFIL